jgi:hypothetical protein
MLKRIAPIFIITCILFLTGCQKQEEKTVQQSPVVQTPPPPVVDTTKKAVEEIADIKGKYTGTFDNRATTLNIKEQDGAKFKGSISINYRDVTNQQVSGQFDPKTLKFSMTDLLHSRYQGKYNGKFSEDKTKMSGVFTMTLDGRKVNFNLTKK